MHLKCFCFLGCVAICSICASEISFFKKRFIAGKISLAQPLHQWELCAAVVLPKEQDCKAFIAFIFLSAVKGLGTLDRIRMTE